WLGEPRDPIHESIARVDVDSRLAVGDGHGAPTIRSSGAAVNPREPLARRSSASACYRVRSTSIRWNRGALETTTKEKAKGQVAKAAKKSLRKILSLIGALRVLAVYLQFPSEAEASTLHVRHSGKTQRSTSRLRGGHRRRGARPAHPAQAGFSPGGPLGIPG